MASLPLRRRSRDRASRRLERDVLSTRATSDGAQSPTAADSLQRMQFRGRFFGSGRFDQRCQREARNFGRAVDADSQPKRAEPAIGIDVEIFVAVQARVKFLADAQNRFERRSVKWNSETSPLLVAGEHHARPEVTRVEGGVGIVREDDRAIVAVDVAERARWLGASRPQVVDADDHYFFVAQDKPAAVVGKYVGAGALEGVGKALSR